MIKAIIFDFFDVIRTDAYKAWLSNQNYKREGQFAELSEKMDRGDITDKEFLETLGRICGRPAEVVLEEMEADTKVDMNVVRIIDKIAGAYKIGLLSNSPSNFLRDLLHDNDLEKYFDVIVISSEVGMIKPNADIFQYILQKMNVQPEETIFIDDNPSNVKAAAELGITGVHFTDALQLEDSLKKLQVTL